MKRLQAQDWGRVHLQLTEFDGLSTKIQQAQVTLQAFRDAQNAEEAKDRRAALVELGRLTQAQQDALQALERERQQVKGQKELLEVRARDWATLEAKASAIQVAQTEVAKEQLAVAQDRGAVAGERRKAQAEQASVSLQLQDLLAKDAKVRQREADVTARETTLTTREKTVTGREEGVAALQAQAEIAKTEIAKYLALKAEAVALREQAETEAQAVVQAQHRLDAHQAHLDELVRQLTTQKAQQEEQAAQLAARQRDIEHRELVGTTGTGNIPSPKLKKVLPR